MAKTIKFNLICDKKPVRTIEDLQNNFCIEDVLEYYKNQLLHRWLRVRGYNQELEAVSAITSKEPVNIVKELIRIFDVVIDEKTVEQSVYILQYLEKRKELCSIYEKENYHTTRIIKDYENGYRQLVAGILENPNNVAKIKANIAEMVSNYAWILELDHRNLFYTLKEKSVLAIMCLLMNEQTRNYYLPVPVRKKGGYFLAFWSYDTENNKDKSDMYAIICSMITTSNFRTELGDNLMIFSGVTDGYWKDIEPRGKKYMIISMENGDFVRPSGAHGIEWDGLTNKFTIMDGIDYKSNSDIHELLYMEV